MILAKTLAILFAAVLVISPLPAQASEDNYITHGPILGRVGATEISVWARTFRAGTLRVRFGLSPDRLDAVSSPVMTLAGRDNSGIVRVVGLQPDTRYYYELVIGEGAQMIPVIQRAGSFRTLPDPESVRDKTFNPLGKFNFSFEFGACNNQLVKGWGPELPPTARCSPAVWRKTSISPCSMVIGSTRKAETIPRSSGSKMSG